MKRNMVALILVLCLFGTSLAGAEGLLPSLADTLGKPMPSLGEALERYPDEEVPGDDGGNTEIFQGITETDFNTFSVYLSENGATLGDYQTIGTTFSASIQMDAWCIAFTYDTQTLEASVTYPEGTYDEWLDYAKTQLASVVQLMDEGKKEEAMSVLLTIPNYSSYRPAAEYLEAQPELAAVQAAIIAAAAHEEKIAPFRNVGGYVVFGSYEQDNNTDNGQEPIEWLVLDYDADNNRALLISRYALDAKPYNTERIGITWEKCTLRTWLNNEFLAKAFTANEQSAILLTNVDNSKSQGYSGWRTNGGNNTQDKVFLLSYNEAWTYFDSDNARKCAPTDYAVKQGASKNSNYIVYGKAAEWWYLRSPGSHQNNAAIVDDDGSRNSNGVEYGGCMIRPALWINLDSGIF